MGASVLVVMNHAGWWDPLSCVRLSEGCDAFRARSHFAPIDAEMLEKYGVFKRLGFFGVASDEAKGARQFLRTGRVILGGAGAGSRALWVTAQGRFADVRERPVVLRPGVAHLLSHLQGQPRMNAVVVVLSIEYVFWDQRTPELLAAFGPVRAVADGATSQGDGRRVDAWRAMLEADLTATMDRLAAAAIGRDPTAFVALASGRKGVGGIYDLGRRIKAGLTGQRFDPRHG